MNGAIVDHDRDMDENARYVARVSEALQGARPELTMTIFINIIGHLVTHMAKLSYNDEQWRREIENGEEEI